MPALRSLREVIQSTFCYSFPFRRSDPTSSCYITTDAVAPVSADEMLDVMKIRRSHYQLSKKLSVSAKQIDKIAQTALAEVPSAFNSQSNRVIVLHGNQHEKLWDITSKVLRAKVPDDQWEHTGEKMRGFKEAAGTVLFFQDEQVVEDLQQKYSKYAETVPFWAAQSDGMLQYALWTLLAAEDIGANLQHYNPLIDEEVALVWDVPKSWKLTGQMVFGGIAGEPGPKGYIPIAERFRSYE